MEKRNGLIIDTDITEMELLAGCKNKVMQRDIESNLRSFEILPMNDQVISIAKKLIRKYSFSHKISISDHFIAATSINDPLEHLC